MKVLFNIYKWFIYIILILIIGSSLWNIIDRASGYNFSCFGLRSCVISSDSMSYVSESNKESLEDIDNRLYKNDLIFNMEVNSIDDLKVNDIVTYVTDNNQLVTHRVYEIVIQDDKGFVVTKGDANNTVDGLIPFFKSFPANSIVLAVVLENLKQKMDPIHKVVLKLWRDQGK